MNFILNGCDISFIAEAPEDITLKQLLKQCDKIKPDWCACGIKSLNKEEYKNTEIDLKISYNNIEKINKNAPCSLMEENNENKTN